MELADVPLLGRKNSWFSSNGKSTSRLDSFMLFEDFIFEWPVSTQWVGQRDILDHCHVWLVFRTCNWGPKPLRFNDCWLEHKKFKGFVEECWGGF